MPSARGSLRRKKPRGTMRDACAGVGSLNSNVSTNHDEESDGDTTLVSPRTHYAHDHHARAPSGYKAAVPRPEAPADATGVAPVDVRREGDGALRVRRPSVPR